MKLKPPQKFPHSMNMCGHIHNKIPFLFNVAATPHLIAINYKLI